MWNQLRTDQYEGMLAETMTFTGYNGDMVNAYFTRPSLCPSQVSLFIICLMGRTLLR
jgi:hypothetical protein